MTCYISLLVRILWKIVRNCSEMQIGLKPPFFLGMKIGLNLYRLLNWGIRVGCCSIELYMPVIERMKPTCFLAMCLRCIGPIPDGPHALCFLVFWIASSTSSTEIGSNAF